MSNRDFVYPIKKEQKKKKMLLVLGIIFFLFIIISIFANKNVTAMNRCVDNIVNEIKENYITLPVDVGEYKKLNLFGIMRFHTEQYNIENLGNLSVMRMNMGIMQMATIVITPKDKNMPLFSADYVYILNSRKSYVEFYDIVSQKDEPYNQLLEKLTASMEKYSRLKDIKVSPAWYDDLLTATAYKRGTMSDDSDLEGMLLEAIQTYLSHSKDLSVLSSDEKALKQMLTIKYTDGLIEKGGISTNVFKKAFGAEKTKEFFDNVFFGTAK